MRRGASVMVAALLAAALARFGLEQGALGGGLPNGASDVVGQVVTDAATSAEPGSGGGETAPGSGSAAASSGAASNSVGSAATGPGSAAYAPTAWDPSASPEYYRVAGPAVVGEVPAPGEVRYGGLDALGRTQGVVANVDYARYEAARGHETHFDAEDDPSGWGHNAKVTIQVPGGKAYHGYLWNRSHLLADSLGGEAARENVVTGTRTQNVGANDGEGGMAYEETRVRDWLRSHPEGTVYYAATPAYVGDELVPRSVFVDVRTSDGTIDEHVEVYNAAAGYTIGYADGTFAPSGE